MCGNAAELIIIISLRKRVLDKERAVDFFFHARKQIAILTILN